MSAARGLVPEQIGELDECISAIHGLAQLLDDVEDPPAPHTLAAILQSIELRARAVLPIG